MEKIKSLGISSSKIQIRFSECRCELLGRYIPFLPHPYPNITTPGFPKKKATHFVAHIWCKQPKKSEATVSQQLPISFGDPLGVRTQDPILKRDVLYLLS